MPFSEQFQISVVFPLQTLHPATFPRAATAPQRRGVRGNSRGKNPPPAAISFSGAPEGAGLPGAPGVGGDRLAAALGLLGTVAGWSREVTLPRCAAA